MNKKELVTEVSRKTNFSKRDCLKCIDAVTDLIKQSVKNGEQVNILGFGKFQLRYRSERTAMNPKTKKLMTLAAYKMPAFKPFRVFKEIVNE